ncbi:glycosyltransferase family 4 protein [Aurantimonas marina]|uniref:glycosyltransferase family 4 protein n=1 Tax=Aurantimonas marina TaxID=2780508 RepID=UPI0019D23DDC|nr:glycosyltransferase family 4 protein [Aurantimonas marina]
MHLLFVSSLLPDDDPSTGFEIANRAIVAAYRHHGVRLTFVGFRRPGSRPVRADEICLGELAIENSGASMLRKAAWVGAALARNLPVAVAKVAGLGRAELLDRLAEAGPMDGYVLSSVQMPAAYPFLAREKPSIFIAHNVEHRSARENAQNAGSIHTRLLYDREAALLERAEADICRDAAVVHTLSEDDRDGLGLAESDKCVPLALTVGRPIAADTGERTHDVGLIGTWSWAPNRVGLDWFVDRVVPLLPSDISIAVAGRFDGPPPAVPANVTFLGRVEDAQRFVGASRVLALATKGGTGVQLKTIETFEEGMPAVATSQALRGVDRVPANVRVADTPRDFADRIVELVAAERAGHSLRLDGAAFARSQATALDAGIAAGLERFTATIDPPWESAASARTDAASPSQLVGTAIR